jgi:chromatin remodeling complex protein RSC6
MARQTKASKPTSADETTTTTTTPVVMAAVAATPEVAAPKVKKTVTKKETPKVEVSVADSAPVVVAAPASASAVVDETVDLESSLTEQFSQFFAKLQQLGVVISTLKTEYKVLEKKCVRELKSSAKSSKKRRKTGNRAPSGFVKPTRISDELASFLGKSSGSEMARTEVTRDINQYIRANKLQDTTNGRKINPDSKLANLLKIKTGEELTYFNLQRYMSPHFAKTSKALAAVAASSV